MNGRIGTLAAVAVLGGCAMKSDVTRVQDEVTLLREESTRQDAARAKQIGELITMQRRLLDSLGGSMKSLRGDVANDLYNINQQLVQLQELTGQSQRRLTEVRTQLEARGEQLAASSSSSAPAPGTAPAGASRDTSAGGTAAPAGNASANQMYEASLAQLRRGSASTARLGFREMLRVYPNGERVPDALYFIGESFRTENADSAAAYYDQVAQTYPQSARAASALYNLGLLHERAKRTAAARDAYQRVVASYPKSDEAALARDRLKALGR